MEKLVFASIKLLFWIFFGNILKILFSKTNFVNHQRIYNWFSSIIIYFVVPFFVGVKIWEYQITKEIFFSVLITYSIVVIISFLTSKYLANKTNFVFQEIFFTLCFMNTLYLGVPVTQYFVSPDAVTYTIIYSIIVTLIQFTFGIYFLAPSFKFLKFLFTSPIIYAAIISYFLKIKNFDIPYTIVIIDNYLSRIISPLMLIFIGYNFKWRYVFENIRIHVFTTIVRIVFIFLLTVCIFLILNNFLVLPKNLVKVLVLISILPSAIMNYILLDKFEFGTKFVLGEIFWGTIISVFLLPYFSEILDLILLAFF